MTDEPRSPGGAGEPRAPESDPTKKPFLPEVMDRTVIAIPLFREIERVGESEPLDLILDVNFSYPGGRAGAKKRIEDLIKKLLASPGARGKGLYAAKNRESEQYLFANLEGRLVRELVRQDQTSVEPPPRAIYKVWPDFDVLGFINQSISTVKADAARNAFGALGRDIVWAVIDSGIDKDHPHFKRYANLDLKPPLRHRDFTATGDLDDDLLAQRAVVDEYGHGTHVAGIIAGIIEAADVRAGKRTIRAKRRKRNENDQPVDELIEDLETISGMAPQTRLLSLKVLDESGKGKASNLIAAVEYIQRLNENGRNIRVQGVNMSVGYNFKPEWFACGQSPLCVEVNRLVKAGVSVVVAAGNTGYGFQESESLGAVASGLALTINDPGNAELAITVGSTHRDMPHVYGVSYFSSKGPTGDGRMKPDLVAPGEKIISCKAGAPREPNAPEPSVAEYKEDSGTSMAAPHVSGVIAAFLSVRREFIGQPEVVKELFLRTATDLKRTPTFQGQGLVDLMRAIQAV